MFPAAEALAKILREMFLAAEKNARRGVASEFILEQLALVGGVPKGTALVFGEFGSGGEKVFVHVWLVSGVIEFDTKDELLRALLAAVPYDVSVRLRNSDTIYRPCKPSGMLSSMGRVEGRLLRPHRP